MASNTRQDGSVPQNNVTVGAGKRPPVQSRAMTPAQRANVDFTIEGIKSSTWMSPQQPLKPMAPPDVSGRQWDFPVAWNLNYIPRAWEPVKFERLKHLAQWSHIARMCIETRKDQISALNWCIRPKAKGKERMKLRESAKGRIEALTEFWQMPDKRLEFPQWVSGVLDQHFMYDGVAIYRQRTRGGQPYAFQQIDASKITLLVDANGRTPLPPSPAYQHILKGIPAADYTTYDTGNMFYEIKNWRADHMYGFGPIEQIIYYVEMAIERMKQQLAFYSHGDKPQGIMEGPPGLTMTQIEEIQGYWDSIFAGNIENRARLWWVPNGSQYTEMKTEVLFDAFDEWLARVICYAFSIAPQPFVKEVNRATAQVSQDVAAAEGLAPTSAWVARLINKIIRTDFGVTDLEFAWEELEEIDPVKKATLHNIYLRAGAETVNEVRDDLGMDPSDNPAADECMFATMNGYVPLSAGTEMHEQGMQQRDLQMQQGKQAMQQGAESHEAMMANGGPGAAQGSAGGTKGKPPGSSAKGPAKPSTAPAKAPAGAAMDKVDGGSVIKISRPVLNSYDLDAWASSAGVQLEPTLELDECMQVTTGLPCIQATGDLPMVLVEPSEMTLSQEGTELWLSLNVPSLASRLAELGNGTGMVTLEPRILLSSTFFGDVSTLPPITSILLLGDEGVENYEDAFAKISHAEVKEQAAQTERHPSDAQRDAGNYKKGHVNIQGLDISIENAAGSIRESRKDKWKAIMPTEYGYIRGTMDADGDQVDVFLGPNPNSDLVFVIDQVSDDGTFDEHKCFIGYNDWYSAMDDYVKSYADAERATPGKAHHNIGGVKRFTMEEFKDWVHSGATKKPIFTHVVKAEIADRGHILWTYSRFDLKKYNEDEPRDERGRWTTGGSAGGMVMVSPNKLDESHWRDAQAGLHSERQAAFDRAAHEINQGLGLHAQVQNAVGAWTDGAENSTLQTFSGHPSFDVLKVSAAMQGLLADQKAVIAFQPNDHGEAMLYTLTVPDAMESVHEQLLAAGVENHTLVDVGDGRTQISVLDFGGEYGDAEITAKMDAVGDHYNVNGSRTRGTGAYITGNDGGETRDSAAAAYKEVISSFAAVHGDGSIAFFQRVSDSWRGAATQKVVTGSKLSEQRNRPGPRWADY